MGLQDNIKGNKVVLIAIIVITVALIGIMSYEFFKPTHAAKPKKIIIVRKHVAAPVVKVKPRQSSATLQTLKKIQDQLTKRNEKLKNSVKVVEQTQPETYSRNVHVKLPNLNTSMIVKFKKSPVNSMSKSEVSTASNRYIQNNNNNYNKPKIPLSYIIPLGTQAYVRLKTKVYSYNVNVPVEAVFTSNITSREGRVIIPAGSEIVGAASASHNNSRISISFKDIIFSNGATYNINLLSTGLNGAAGVEGNVHEHYPTKILEGIGQALLGVGSLVVGAGNVTTNTPYSMQSQVRENVANTEINNATNSLNNSTSNTYNNTLITINKNKLFEVIFMSPFADPNFK